ncbi:glycerol-3-phosphate dehydrogenase/oxidase [Hymenobacter taeanensis]|uniref:Glycerol-3-phosphate dehydrogenase/oxidase n=1 Tax=Hymenobacter taeanensis TaxID=2735321 RepID=A0A6M6BI61_9BACT|nr:MULTISPECIES: glycerol-3-phosphate dehydrogenase/oxidase [Hymenobacter]QJX47588.1 glycerol-3-phosphate dehydrogenase/oxidase [Hymenobacter taeanensis]UOQ82928.1 glycerol-3-phosphate dehydrogenase/oxidase [Hymenobacter sp. 5414T-23]
MQQTPPELLFQREHLLQQLTQHPLWDLLVIGGGATGLGIALDGASRGYKTLLLEQADYAKGTSSRSTKLVHGGVRYLAQGDVGLVREALYERGLLLKNAPHLVKNQDFIIPNYDWWGGPFYTMGLKMYDLLAGELSLGASVHLSKDETLQRLSNIKPQGLRGGVLYHDGQFDDARLAINLAQTAIEQGAVLLNHFGVHGLLKDALGQVAGVSATDEETGTTYELRAKVVVNATGVFVDDILQMDQPGARKLVRPSQGVHIVVEKSFLPGDDALMIPKTEDGRVLFAVPWHGRVVLGTTDTPLQEHSLEPQALEEEIDFILRTAAQYLTRAPQRSDALSIFAGLRPLAAPQDGSEKTKEISRSHKILVSPGGLITITGGKWTTYRRMAQDTVDKAIALGKLPLAPSQTAYLSIHGAQPTSDRSSHLYVYGSDLPALQQLITERPELGQKLDEALEFLQAEVVWAARHEMARTVEDVLARRVRVLFLDARAALRIAPTVAALLAQELGKDQQWQEQQVAGFTRVAQHYVLKEKPTTLENAVV